MIEIQTLCSLLAYDSTTGDLVWRQHVSDKVRAGSIAGHLRKDGYRTITVQGSRFLAHRLVWAINTGSWPAHNIDHINGNPSDNRIENLRDVGQRQNIQNLYSAKSHNKLGLLGVVRDREKFAARIVVNGKRIHLGSFTCPNAAHAAYIKAKQQHHVEQSAAIERGEPIAGARIVRRDRLTIK